MAYRRVPGALESSRDLTIYTFPPLPPVVFIPPPSAPGKAYAVSSTGGDTEGESGGVSCSLFSSLTEDVEQEENASTCVANSSATKMNFTLLFFISYLIFYKV